MREEDFADYLSFRKILDYFERFHSCNARFNNYFGARYTEEAEFSDQEMLVRRIVVHLRNGGFPIGVAVPTDANPNYVSPIVDAVQNILGQHQKLLHEPINDGILDWRVWSNRQVSYLISNILEELKNLDAIYADVFGILRR